MSRKTAHSLSHSLIVCGKMRLRKRMVRTKELGRIAFLLVIYSAKVVETIDLISPGFLMRFSVTEKALSSNLNSRIQCMATVKCVEMLLISHQPHTIPNNDEHRTSENTLWMLIFFRSDVALIFLFIQPFTRYTEITAGL